LPVGRKSLRVFQQGKTLVTGRKMRLAVSPEKHCPTYSHHQKDQDWRRPVTWVKTMEYAFQWSFLETLKDTKEFDETFFSGQSPVLSAFYT
jgi:hypothetical protein